MDLIICKPTYGLLSFLQNKSAASEVTVHSDVLLTFQHFNQLTDFHEMGYEYFIFCKDWNVIRTFDIPRTIQKYVCPQHLI